MKPRDINKERLLNISYFIWFLISLPISELYYKNFDSHGFFFKVFIFLLAASPVWIIFFWRYLTDKLPIPKVIHRIILFIYALALVIQPEISYNSDEQIVLVGIVILGYWTLLYVAQTFPNRPTIIDIGNKVATKTKQKIIYLAPKTKILFDNMRTTIVIGILLGLLFFILTTY